MLFDNQLILVSLFYRTIITETTTEVAFWEILFVNLCYHFLRNTWQGVVSNRSHKSWVIVLKIHLMASVFWKPFNEL